MLFSGIPFLYYFLPAVMLVYFLVPQRFRNGVLLVFSLVFYGWGEPKVLGLMVATILSIYGCGLAMEAGDNLRWKRFWLVFAVVINVGLLAVMKYADFAVSTVNSITGLALPLPGIALPVGISFYTFQCLSYIIDVYRGDAQVQKNPVTFGSYVAMFPQLIAGPIVRYVDVVRELDSRSHSWENVFYGVNRFLIGLGKKILLADQFALLVRLFRDSGEKSLLFYWMYAVAFSLNIYFDFSGYSDMAIGLGRIFGFHFLENFRYPFLSESVTEFWRRWHISLGSWFRDYIYIPMGGNRVTRSRWIFNILVVWMLTGLWHGAAWNFVLWGLFFAMLLLLEKAVPGLQRLPSLLKRVYVLTAILVSFVLFNAQSLSQAGQDIACMFGFGGIPLVSAPALYYCKSYALLFLAGFVGSTPLLSNLGQRIGKTRWGSCLAPVIWVLLLLVCTAYLVDGSFSPFLYFRF